MYSDLEKWVDKEIPSEESTSEPEVKKPSFSFGKTEEKKEEVSKPSFSFGSTSLGLYSWIHGQRPSGVHQIITHQKFRKERR